jgi:uncharacterized protein (TIGR02271 family)
MKNDTTKRDANRDPITCEPGAHPVGTGVGSAAGGAAGAAIGAMAGPVGAGVGAVAGAVAGGLAGKGAAEGANPTSLGELRRYLDYTVVDRDNSRVGTIDAVWEDHTSQPAYLAVRTGWLGMGKAHVVPAQSASVNESSRTIRLPYTSDQIKQAPAFDCQSDITFDSEKQITSYYTKHGYRDRAPETHRDRSARTEENTTMRLKEEEVTIGKREVEYGGVRLRKIVKTETVNQPVELKREEIVIERVPVTDKTAQGAEFKEKEIYIPLRREEAVVAKEAKVREEVRVGKKTDVSKEQISETVRREDVEVEKNEFESERMKSGSRSAPTPYQPKERSRRT